VVAQPDGQILLGVTTQAGSDTYPRHQRIVRLNADGSLDPGFAGDGVAELDFAGPYSTDLAPDHLGGVYFLAGGPYDSGGPPQLIARLDPAGVLDPAFSGDGYTFSDLSSSGAEADDQGRLVFAGSTPDLGSGHSNDVDLRRLTVSGSPDPSFSGDGRVTTDLSGVGSGDYVSGLTLDPQGRIVVNASGDGPHLLRYLTGAGPADRDADGVLDPDDVCPERFGQDDRGCRRFPPSISLAYSRRIDDFTGTIDYGPVRPCVEGAIVRLYRIRRGPDKLIGRSPRTGDEPPAYPALQSGREWGVSALRRRGRYYAAAKPRTLTDTGICAPGRSGTLKIKRRRGPR
jgi:uncharacterized delta-60 repeat protein